MSTYADYDHESYDVAVFSLLSLNILLNSGIIFWIFQHHQCDTNSHIQWTNIERKRRRRNKLNIKDFMREVAEEVFKDNAKDLVENAIKDADVGVVEVVAVEFAKEAVEDVAIGVVEGVARGVVKGVIRDILAGVDTGGTLSS